MISIGKNINKRRFTNGFTIVELLIVIAVVGILAAISIVAYSDIQTKARDNIRKQDLANLAKAIKLYNIEVGDYAEAGCGNGTGTGWLHSDYDGLAGPYVSINDCLMGKGSATSEPFLSSPLKDPSGLNYCSGLTCTAYMKASCFSGTWVMAHLESLPQTNADTNATCQPGWDTSYGINYVLKVD